MSSEKRIFDTNYPVHVVSRAVNERNIFNDEIDCFRFIFQIYATNIGRPVHNLWRQDIIKAAQSLLNGEELSSRFIMKEHPPLVQIIDFSLVVNHSHFYLLSDGEKNIPMFLQRLNAGFAKYYNLKYKRKGSVFGSRYRAVVVKNQTQSDTVSRYISIMNPLDIFQPGWRESGLKDKNAAMKFLEEYHFSSFPDRIGMRKSKILTSPEISGKYLSINLNGAGDYREFVESFLGERASASEPAYLE